MAGLCHYFCCQCCSNKSFYHFWNWLVFCEIIRMSVWIFDYEHTIMPLKKEYGVGRIGLTVSYVYFAFLCLTFLIYFFSLCCRRRTSMKYCVVVSHKMLLWMTFLALFADNILYLANDKYYCPEVDANAGQQPQNVFDDIDKEGLRQLHFHSYSEPAAKKKDPFDDLFAPSKPAAQTSSYNAGPQSSPAPSTSSYGAVGGASTSLNGAPAQGYGAPQPQYGAPQPQYGAPQQQYAYGNNNMGGYGRQQPNPWGNFWGFGRQQPGLKTVETYCPEDRKIDMTTLWVFDGIFLLILLPIWFRANKILFEHADESFNEDPQVFEDEKEEIEMKDDNDQQA